MRYVRAILLMLVALAYAGTAGAYTIDVVGPSEAAPSDPITVDIMVDTEGNTWYGIQMYVTYDTAVLSSVSATMNYAPGMLPGYPYSSLYLYPGGGKFFIMQSVLAPAPAFNGSIATLVFHVMDVPASTNTVIDANFTAGPYGIMVGAGATDVTGIVVITDGNLHVVPEPTTTMLMGLGLLGILYAGRRR